MPEGLRLPRLLALASAALWLAWAPSADARMSVTNLGQAEFVSEPPQPALELDSRGGCAEIYSVRQANGAPSACGTSPWPATGVGAWMPILQVAGGDQMQLQFAGPVDEVTFSSTTDGPPEGQTAPDGAHASNRQTLGPQAATPTTDPSIWMVSLPGKLDVLTYSGLTFAVVSRAADQYSDYAFGIKTPRERNFGGPCGPAFYGPGDIRSTCTLPFGGPPPLPTPSDSSPYATPPTARLLDKRARLRHRRVRVRVRTTAQTSLAAKLRHRGRLAGSATNTSGKPKLVLSMRLSRRLTRAVKRSHSVKVTVLLGACTLQSCDDTRATLRIRT